MSLAEPIELPFAVRCLRCGRRWIQAVLWPVDVALACEGCGGYELEREAMVVANEPIMEFFEFAHLPPHLQEVSRPFGELAQKIVAELPRNPERTVALRKLLEAKDAAVRARLAKISGGGTL